MTPQQALEIRPPATGLKSLGFSAWTPSVTDWGHAQKRDDPGQGSSLHVVKLEVPQFLQSLNSFSHFVQNSK